MNKLQEANVVVAGGTGGVGEGLVRAFLLEGATVIVPYRHEVRRQRLEEYIGELAEGRLHLFPAELGDEQSVAAFRSNIKEQFGSVDLGVSCIGGWYYGYSLHKMPYDHWQSVIHNNLTTHFLCMRAIVSLMHEQKRGVYVMVNGGAAEYIAPESGAVSIVAAAQLMMARVLKQEAHGTNIRIHSLVAYHPVKTRDRRREVVDDWLTPEEVGDYLTRLYRGEVPDAAKTIHRLYTRQSTHR